MCVRAVSATECSGNMAGVGDARKMSRCGSGSGGGEIMHREKKHIRKYIKYNGSQFTEGN